MEDLDASAASMSQMPVKPLVFGVREQLQVVETVVVLHTVHVMNVLVGLQLATEVCRHDQAVLELPLADARLDDDIPVTRSHVASAGDFLDAGVRSVLAPHRAEPAGVDDRCELVGLDLERFTAVLACASDTGSLAAWLAGVATAANTVRGAAGGTLRRRGRALRFVHAPDPTSRFTQSQGPRYP